MDYIGGITVLFYLVIIGFYHKIIYSRNKIKWDLKQIFVNRA